MQVVGLKAMGDLEELRATQGTVRQAQERADVVLRQAADDSKELGVVSSDLGWVKQTVTAAEARAGEQARMLADVRSELGSLQQRHATVASGTAADKVLAAGTDCGRARPACVPPLLHRRPARARPV